MTIVTTSDTISPAIEPDAAAEPDRREAAVIEDQHTLPGSASRRRSVVALVAGVLVVGSLTALSVGHARPAPSPVSIGAAGPLDTSAVRTGRNGALLALTAADLNHTRAAGADPANPWPTARTSSEWPPRSSASTDGYLQWGSTMSEWPPATRA